MLLIGMCTSLTKKPTKPMIKNPIIVADAIRANSFLSGLVHFFTRWIESCVCDVSVMCLCRGDGAAAACVLRSSVVAERARRGGRVCVAATARRVCCVMRLATAAAAQ